MRTDKERELETAHSLLILLTLKKLLDQARITAGQAVHANCINPKTKWLCEVLLTDNEFLFAEEVEKLIEVLQEERKFYGEGVDIS